MCLQCTTNNARHASADSEAMTAVAVICSCETPAGQTCKDSGQLAVTSRLLVHSRGPCTSVLVNLYDRILVVGKRTSYPQLLLGNLKSGMNKFFGYLQSTPQSVRIPCTSSVSYTAVWVSNSCSCCQEYPCSNAWSSQAQVALVR